MAITHGASARMSYRDWDTFNQIIQWYRAIDVHLSGHSITTISLSGQESEVAGKMPEFSI